MGAFERQTVSPSNPDAARAVFVPISHNQPQRVALRADLSMAIPKSQGELKNGMRCPDSQFIRRRNSHPARLRFTTPIKAMGQNWFSKDKKGAPCRKTSLRTIMK